MASSSSPTNGDLGEAGPIVFRITLAEYSHHFQFSLPAVPSSNVYRR